MSDQGGYVVVGPCYVCGRVFSFNPYRVPSVPVDPETRLPLDVDAHGKPKQVDPEARERAVREQICEDCVERINTTRVARGQDPLVILPGAYDFVPGLPE